MSRSRKALVILFIALQLLGALGLLGASIHGPDGLQIAAFAYAVIAALATLFAARRIGGWLPFSAVGLGLVGLVPVVFVLLTALEDFTNKRRMARTRVENVRDEPIISAAGRAIGIRVSYDVTVPGRGYFGVLPTLSVQDPRNSSGTLHATRWTIDGRRDPVPFEPGKTRSMVVELYPSILVFPQGERCLSQHPAPPPEPAGPAPLLISISDSPYGNVYNGGREQLTRGSYDLAQLYSGVLAEGLATCKTP